MNERDRTESNGILARQVPAAIRFLRALEVPATKIAGIFGETADNIRHIDARSYKDTPAIRPKHLKDEDSELLKLTPSAREAEYKRQMQCIRLRTKLDLELAEATVWSVFENHRSIGMAEGYDTLLTMLPGVANARHGAALKVRLLIEEKLAWFALNSGYIKEALIHAKAAMQLALSAFRNSAGLNGYLLRYGEAALVASVCLQKMHQPTQALRFIEAADRANVAIGHLPGSEHLRQRAVSMLQVGNSDDESATTFRQARERMLVKGEARNDVDLSMMDLRQRSLLSPAKGWEQVQELLRDVASVYGDGSLQYRVAATSTAATGLKYSTSSSTETALALLARFSPVHSDLIQRGIPHILSITPDLKLSPEKLDRWLRFAISETPLTRRK